jgi:hypothetical protein
MNKLILLIGILLFAGYVSAAPALPAVPALVTGYVMYQNGTGVDGATVDITCQHNDVNTTLSTSTYEDGSYYQEFSDTQCSYNDMVWVNAEKSGNSGSNDGQTCERNDCFIPVALIDVTIPEFGIIASMVAMIGALGIFVLKRKE